MLLKLECLSCLTYFSVTRYGSCVYAVVYRMTLLAVNGVESGRRDSNPRPLAWEANALAS